MLLPTSFWVTQEYSPDTLASPISKVLTVYTEGQRCMLVITTQFMINKLLDF